MESNINDMGNLNFIDLLMDMLKIEERIQKLENIGQNKLLKFLGPGFKLEDRLEILKHDRKKRSEIQKTIVSLSGKNRWIKTDFLNKLVD